MTERNITYGSDHAYPPKIGQVDPEGAQVTTQRLESPEQVVHEVESHTTQNSKGGFYYLQF